MMRLRRIVIMLDGSHGDAALMRQGVGLCRALDARADALFVRRNVASGGDFLGDAFSTYGMEAVLEALADAATLASEQARASFDRAADDAPDAAIGRFIEYIGLPDAALAAEGRLCDLILMPKPAGERGAHHLHSIDVAATQSGRPVLLLPEDRDPDAGFHHIVIAWDGSLEATRAVIGAMPLLQSAQSVAVLHAGGDADAAEKLAGLARYLEIHRVVATTRTIDLDGRGVAMALIDAATGSEADLLVMGGFGAPGWVRLLGRDATTAVVKGSSLAVLLAH